MATPRGFKIVSTSAERASTVQQCQTCSTKMTGMGAPVALAIEGAALVQGAAGVAAWASGIAVLMGEAEDGDAGAHEQKLEAYRATPEVFDNKGFLKNAPTPEIRQNVIDRRNNHLEGGMENFRNQIELAEHGGG